MTDANINIAEPVYDLKTITSVSPILESTPWLKNSTPRSQALFELFKVSDTKSEWPLVVHLINNFTYVNEDLFNESKQKIAERIVSWIKSNNVYYIVAMSDEDEADGSQSLLQSLKNAEPFNGVFDEDDFINSITAGVKKIEADMPFNQRRNIVLIDDFIGTGKTIKRKIEWLDKALTKMGVREKVGIRLCALAYMSNSQQVISYLMDEQKLLNDFFSPIVVNRGISDHFNEPELSQNMELMKSLESGLAEKVARVRGKALNLKDHNFGYNKSEAIYSWADNNLPNNVFPIFWWALDKNNKKRKTIFRRI